jgi:hypothetical protein
MILTEIQLANGVLNMNEVIESIPLNDGSVLQIVPDEDPLDPRENDNIGIMVFLHRRYSIGDKHDIKESNFHSFEEIKNYLIKKKKAILISPVFMIDHSGISIRINRNFSDVDPGNWDSGQIGFIYTTNTQIKKMYLEKGKKITPEILEKIKECLISEIEEYNEYLSGSAYGYQILKNGEIQDSCYGYLGYSGIEYIKDQFKDLME